MVVVQCYHCNTILELDEGFRGGVCRCSTCGSLLQVPKAATTGAPKARPAAPGAVPTEAKRDGRPANPNADAGLSRGQFDPKNVSGASGVRPAVPDLGGSSSGLRQARPAAPVATAEASPKVRGPLTAPTRPSPHLKQVRKNNRLLYVGIALFAVILIIVVLVVIKVFYEPENHTTGSRGETSGGRGKAGLEGGSGDAAAPEQSGLLGVPLVGKKIVVSIDAASSMNNCFDYVRVAVTRAAGKLEPGQEIEVALWKDDQLKLVPATGFVGKAGLAGLQEQLDGVATSGASDAGACMKASAALGGDQVIFVTAKDSIDPQIAQDLLAGSPGIRFDAIKIGEADEQSPLKILAAKSKGVSEALSLSRLEQLSK